MRCFRRPRPLTKTTFIFKLLKPIGQSVVLFSNFQCFTNSKRSLLIPPSPLFSFLFFFFFSLSLSVSSPPPPSLCLFLAHVGTHTLSQSLSLFLSVCLCLCLSLSVCLSVCLSVSPSLSHIQSFVRSFVSLLPFTHPLIHSFILTRVSFCAYLYIIGYFSFYSVHIHKQLQELTNTSKHTSAL